MVFAFVVYPDTPGYVRPHRADLKKSIAQGFSVRLPQ
ncbi:Uncharacterised protein [Klebsiella pneumoniae]|nr:Uncharacterised protein [Klebsiella pneumoniae]